MASADLGQIIDQVETLSPEEQLRLIAHLANRVRLAYQMPPPRRRWSEIRGIVEYPLLGEDAQAWVSRTRREGDEYREQQSEQKL